MRLFWWDSLDLFLLDKKF